MLPSFDEATYLAAVARLKASDEFWDKHASGSKERGRSMSSELAAQDPASNADREIVEVYRFERVDHSVNNGGAYFAYWKDDRDVVGAERPFRITTWTGATLGIVTDCREYTSRGAVKSTRVTFRALCIDGHLWSGTYYKSSGDYVRMKRTFPKPLYKRDRERMKAIKDDFALRCLLLVGEPPRTMTDMQTLRLRNFELRARLYGPRKEDV